MPASVFDMENVTFWLKPLIGDTVAAMGVVLVGVVLVGVVLVVPGNTNKLGNVLIEKSAWLTANAKAFDDPPGDGFTTWTFRVPALARSLVGMVVVMVVELPVAW